MDLPHRPRGLRCQRHLALAQEVSACTLELLAGGKACVRILYFVREKSLLVLTNC